MTDKRVNTRIAVFMAIAAFVLFAFTLVPSVYDGDYGEFQYMPRILGLPHPTGYPLYMLQGWLGSWLPIGALAWRMNLLSAFWGAVTAYFVVKTAQMLGSRPVAALWGAATLCLAPFFWGYATLAAVYTLNTALLAAALWLWLGWSAAQRNGGSTSRPLWLAAFVTGLALTNHPTAAFLVPSALLFVALHGRMPWRHALVAMGLFALPGILYLYVPLRLATIAPGAVRGGMIQSIAQGRVAPYLDWGSAESVLRYITGRSLLGSYDFNLALLWERLPSTLATQLGWPAVILAGVGLLVLLRHQLRAALLLFPLFLFAALYALSYAASFDARNQIAHVEGHILPALLVAVLWAAVGVEWAMQRLAMQRLPTLWATIIVTVVAMLLLWLPHRGRPLPYVAQQRQSVAIENYWRELLAYPLPQESALVGHWGDLTAFWYFQQGEQLRPDLWAIFPPDANRMSQWTSNNEGPLYIAGPLLDWGTDLSESYEMTPWGILVQLTAKDATSPLPLPPQTAREIDFGEGAIGLESYGWTTISSTRRQLWLVWKTDQPVPRDLSLSLRLHSPDGSQLFQEDGRLASLWYPEGTLPVKLRFASVLDIALPADLPPDSEARLVLYDPTTVIPWLTTDGQDVVTLGPIE